MQNSEKFGKEQSYSNQTQGSAELVSWLLCWPEENTAPAGTAQRAGTELCGWPGIRGGPWPGMRGGAEERRGRPRQPAAGICSSVEMLGDATARLLVHRAHTGARDVGEEVSSLSCSSTADSFLAQIPGESASRTGGPHGSQAGQIQGRAVEGCGGLGDGNEQPTSWPRGAAPGWRAAAPGVEGAPGGGWQRLGWRAPRARRRKPPGEELSGGSSRNPSRQRRDERAPRLLCRMGKKDEPVFSAVSGDPISKWSITEYL